MKTAVVNLATPPAPVTSLPNLVAGDHAVSRFVSLISGKNPTYIMQNAE
jgi:hypothetical protein